MGWRSAARWRDKCAALSPVIIKWTSIPVNFMISESLTWIRQQVNNNHSLILLWHIQSWWEDAMTEVELIELIIVVCDTVKYI